MKGDTSLNALAATQSGPVRLIVPDKPTPPHANYAAVGAFGGLAVLLLAASLAAWLLARRDRRLAGDPLVRARMRLYGAVGFNNAQKKAIEELASGLGPHADPAALILSRSALRRAVGVALERRPDAGQARRIQQVVQRLAGDIETDQTSEYTAAGSRAARSSTAVTNRSA